jgi:hypothetical protein
MDLSLAAQLRWFVIQLQRSVVIDVSFTRIIFARIGFLFPQLSFNREL